MNDDDFTPAELRAAQALVSAGLTADQTNAVLALLRQAGLHLNESARGDLDEFLVRWVPTTERAVPPEADTIIRTLTHTRGDEVRSGSFWLEGLRGPRF